MLKQGSNGARQPESKRRYQYSIWALLVLTTAICVLLAVPGGYLLLVTLGLWILIGAGIMVVLLVLQAPVYALFRRRLGGDSEDTEEPARRSPNICAAGCCSAKG
jgi:hypothetical protein